MENEILDSLYEGTDLHDGDVEFDGPYGVGTWRDAVLMDVLPVKEHEWGFRVSLVLNLKGDSMKYTGRVSLPQSVEENGDHDKFERLVKRENRTRNTVSGLLLSAGLIKAGKQFFNVDDEESYDKALQIFRAGIGEKFPCRVKVQQKFNKETEKWENTDFTELTHIKVSERSTRA